jgi:hypothetical protein
MSVACHLQPLSSLEAEPFWTLVMAPFGPTQKIFDTKLLVTNYMFMFHVKYF